MRGLRLRSSNIQLGNDDVLSNLFKERRGNYYFVGEVFAVNKALVPNSQRDYFNENPTRVVFEDAIRTYFYDVLHKLYTSANRMKNNYKHQEDYVAKVEEYNKKSENGEFIDEDARRNFLMDVEKAKSKAEEAQKNLSKFEGIDSSSPLAAVRKSISEKYNSDNLKKKTESTQTVDPPNTNKKQTYITSSMSKLSKSERKIVSKILTIITDIAPKEIAEQLIDKIKEEMR